MRFLLAVLVGGVLIGARYWNELDAVPWPIQLGFMSVVALAVGFVVGRRGWLAALAAFVVGHALWVAVELRPSPLGSILRGEPAGFWSTLQLVRNSSIAR